MKVSKIDLINKIINRLNILEPALKYIFLCFIENPDIEINFSNLLKIAFKYKNYKTDLFIEELYNDLKQLEEEDD